MQKIFFQINQFELPYFKYTTQQAVDLSLEVMLFLSSRKDAKHNKSIIILTNFGRYQLLIGVPDISTCCCLEI